MTHMERREGLLLTAAEHRAVEEAGKLYTFIARHICGEGPTRSHDLAELAQHVHAIQHLVMAQAAARAYPDTYRLMGESFMVNVS